MGRSVKHGLDKAEGLKHKIQKETTNTLGTCCSKRSRSALMPCLSSKGRICVGERGLSIYAENHAMVYCCR